MIHTPFVPPSGGNRPPFLLSARKAPGAFPPWTQWLLGFMAGALVGLLPSLLFFLVFGGGSSSYDRLATMGFFAAMIGGGATPIVLLLFGISLGLGALVHRSKPTLHLGTLHAFWAGLALGFFLLLVLGMTSCAVSCPHLPGGECG